MAAAQRPNIIFLIGDQWRAKSTGYYGNPVVKTPCIDALAAEGAGFTNCHVQGTVSTPSRATFASGRYCHVAGHRTMHHHLRMHEANMLRTFKENGYFVFWTGKNDMVAMECKDVSCDAKPPSRWDQRKKDVKNPYPVGHRLHYSFLYGEVPTFYFAPDDSVIENAVNFINSPPTDKPFFMLINNELPHPPYAVDAPWHSMYDRSKVPFPIRQEVPFEGKPQILREVSKRAKLEGLTEEDWREIVAVYYGMCSRLDNNFQTFIEALKASGQYDNSLIFITSDHGDYTGDYLNVEKFQNTFEDSLTNVPLAVKAPGCKPIGTTDALCQWIDLMPTAFEFAGIDPVETHFGKSLAPILRGETSDVHEYVYCEGGALKTEEHTHERKDKPQDHLYWPRQSVQNTIREYHGKAVMMRSKEFKYVRRLYDTDELYDLRNDPNECVNRIDDPALAEVQRTMKDTMLEWFLETGDAVPWRWNLRHPYEKHPPISENQRTYGTV